VSGEATVDPQTVAARARVAALLERLARIELGVVVVAPPDAIRIGARERARDAAIVAGRHALLDEATAATRDVALRTFARAGFSGTWAATEMAASVATADDRVAAAAAFEEAATAAVVEDLVDTETLEVLNASLDDLDRARGIPVPGSLAAIGAPAGRAAQGPLQVVIIAAAVIVGMAFAIGSVSGLIVTAMAIAVFAGLARRLARSDR